MSGRVWGGARRRARSQRGGRVGRSYAAREVYTLHQYPPRRRPLILDPPLFRIQIWHPNPWPRRSRRICLAKRSALFIVHFPCARPHGAWTVCRAPSVRRRPKSAKGCYRARRGPRANPARHGKHSHTLRTNRHPGLVRRSRRDLLRALACGGILAQRLLATRRPRRAWTGYGAACAHGRACALGQRCACARRKES